MFDPLQDSEKAYHDPFDKILGTLLINKPILYGQNAPIQMPHTEIPSPTPVNAVWILKQSPNADQVPLQWTLRGVIENCNI